eukprot:2648457-Pyramimonas_sp.AAC.1
MARAFVAWASDGKEAEEWFNYGRCPWQWSEREYPSRALRVDARDAVALPGQAALAAATHCSRSFRHGRGK